MFKCKLWQTLINFFGLFFTGDRDKAVSDESAEVGNLQRWIINRALDLFRKNGQGTQHCLKRAETPGVAAGSEKWRNMGRQQV
jgi:hypothetical protein